MRIVQGRGEYVDPDNPYAVVGKECTCWKCYCVFVPESDDDILRITSKLDSLVRCPECGYVGYHYYGTDEQVHSGWISCAENDEMEDAL